MDLAFTRLKNNQPYHFTWNNYFGKIEVIKESDSSQNIGGIKMRLTVYLAGQIHDNWRDVFRQKAADMGLAVECFGPMENHDRSDSIGEDIIGSQPNPILRDEAASQLNNLRTQVLMQKADVVVALFGPKYKQWNTAMDAGIAIALNKPLIIIRDEENHHALKEIANRAQVVVQTMDQALQAIAYILEA